MYKDLKEVNNKIGFNKIKDNDFTKFVVHLLVNLGLLGFIIFFICNLYLINNLLNVILINESILLKFIVNLSVMIFSGIIMVISIISGMYIIEWAGE